jgi:predicted P-loop ATPase
MADGSVQDRQCVFIATTNQEDYLKDPTGGRRFWPVKVGRSTPTRSRMTGPAFARSPSRLQPAGALVAGRSVRAEHIAPEQENRFVGDPWEQAITTFFTRSDKATLTEIAKEALGFETAKIGTADAHRMRAVLQSLGFVSLKKDWRGNRYWARP